MGPKIIKARAYIHIPGLQAKDTLLMHKFKIFISSVQKELETERLAIDELITDNPVFSRYFETVLFEKIPAMAISSKKVYLDSLKKSDIYIGVLGFEYGTVGKDGLSATEREYRLAAKYKKISLFFIKGKQDEKRDKRIRKILREIKDEEGVLFIRDLIIIVNSKTKYSKV